LAHGKALERLRWYLPEEVLQVNRDFVARYNKGIRHIRASYDSYSFLGNQKCEEAARAADRFRSGTFDPRF
jgi:hypothetical protein